MYVAPVHNQKLYTCTTVHVGVSEQVLGWFPLSFGLVMEDEPSELRLLLLHVSTFLAVDLFNLLLTLPLQVRFE